jgi:SAM-dependent methyltransferase
MRIFDAYASFYDLIYEGKDYLGEADFVLRRLERFGRLNSILDFGCGTGRHAVAFAGRGLEVHGVDLSEQMIERARERAAASGSTRATFGPGDMRTLSLGRSFDAAVALFHVVSYMSSDEDLDCALRVVRSHLGPGAPFLFDFWYAEAIRRDGVERRERTIETESWRIRRRTEPLWDRPGGIVSVTFDVSAENKESGEVVRCTETHHMRYFDLDFLARHLSAAGFSMSESGEWMSENPARADSLGAYVLARAA